MRRNKHRSKSMIEERQNSQNARYGESLSHADIVTTRHEAL